MADTQKSDVSTGQKGSAGKGRVATSLLDDKGFTPKQGTFIKGVVDGKTGVQAAMDAYDTDNYNTAAVIAAENLKKPNIKEALQKAYDNAGITPDRIAQVLEQGMTARKSTNYNGVLVETELADHSVRITAARTAAQLIGGGKEEGSGAPSITFNIGNKYVKDA